MSHRAEEQEEQTGEEQGEQSAEQPEEQMPGQLEEELQGIIHHHWIHNHLTMEEQEVGKCLEEKGESEN